MKTGNVEDRQVLKSRAKQVKLVISTTDSALLFSKSQVHNDFRPVTSQAITYYENLAKGEVKTPKSSGSITSCLLGHSKGGGYKYHITKWWCSLKYNPASYFCS